MKYLKYYIKIGWIRVKKFKQVNMAVRLLFTLQLPEKPEVWWRVKERGLRLFNRN